MLCDGQASPLPSTYSFVAAEPCEKAQVQGLHSDPSTSQPGEPRCCQSLSFLFCKMGLKLFRAVLREKPSGGLKG